MLEKGIILEIKEKYAIALKPGGEMVRIKKKEGLQVGEQIFILPEDYYAESENPALIPFPQKKSSGNSGRRKTLLRQLTGLAAAVVLAVTLTLYPGVQTVYAVASFDGDQDLQLELDDKSRIVNGYSYGKLISEEEIHSLKGKKLSDVGDQLIELIGNGPVLIGYASYEESDDADTQTEQLLRDMFSNHTILYLSGNGEDIELAESAKTSLGLHLAGEVENEDAKEVLEEFLEEYNEHQEKLDQSPDSEDDDCSALDDKEEDELPDESQQDSDEKENKDAPNNSDDKKENPDEERQEQAEEHEDSNSENSESSGEEEQEDSDPREEDD